MGPWRGSIVFKNKFFLGLPTELRLLLVNDRTVCRKRPWGVQKTLHAWMLMESASGIAVLESLVRHFVGIVRRPIFGWILKPSAGLRLFCRLVANNVWHFQGYMGIHHGLRNWRERWRAKIASGQRHGFLEQRNVSGDVSDGGLAAARICYCRYPRTCRRLDGRKQDANRAFA